MTSSLTGGFRDPQNGRERQATASSDCDGSGISAWPVFHKHVGRQLAAHPQIRLLPLRIPGRGSRLHERPLSGLHR